jgi:hypothetical protein
MHATTAGPAELDLLTQDHIQPAQAELPYAADVRLVAAAQTTDAAAQVKLFMEAIAIRPEPVEPRRDLARAALRAKRDRLAVVAFESASEAPSYLRRYNDANQIANAAVISDAERELSEEIASAYRRLNEPQSALSLYARILASSPSVEMRKRVEQARDAISAQMRLLAANQLRAPLLLPAIDQPGIVRPRLTTPPPLDPDSEQPNEGGGGAQ